MTGGNTYFLPSIEEWLIYKSDPFLYFWRKNLKTHIFVEISWITYGIDFFYPPITEVSIPLYDSSISFISANSPILLRSCLSYIHFVNHNLVLIGNISSFLQQLYSFQCIFTIMFNLFKYWNSWKRKLI